MEAGKAMRRPFIPRKPHTKSRGACSFCKERKVKCSETRPSCELCTGKGVICAYPQPQKSHSTRKAPGSLFQPHFTPQSVPTTFSMSDLRLFHHFLLHASPHHPLGNEKAWAQDVPALAHQYEFLMHAILALAASNLTAISSANLSGAAISHRVDAVRGVKDAINHQKNSVSHIDALLASFFIFGFQALYIDDGLVDFLTMIRGCTLISAQIQSEGLATVFRFPGLENYTQAMDSGEADMPCLSIELAIAAFASLQALKPLCTHDVELLVLSLLEDIVVQMQSSTAEAYFHVTSLYAAIARFSIENFMYLTEPTNATMQLLLGHFVAVHVLAGPLIVQEGFRSKKLLGMQKVTNWLDGIVENAGPENLCYLEWPMAVTRLDELAISQSQP